MALSIPDLDDVRAAARRIEPFVHRTPVARCTTIDRELDAEVHFKCENFQKVGAFKARGATNAVLQLDDEAASRGVITHSSGNHGAALAFAAGRRQIPCTVVMPESAPAVKVAAVRGYGAEVVFCKIGERESTTERLIAERGQRLVHSYEDPHVATGQGTAALELMQEVEGLDLVVAPLGGGGLLSGTTIAVKGLRPETDLLSGTTIAVKGLRPETDLWGAEPETVDDAYRSMLTGVRQPAPQNPKSWADGLLTRLGELAFTVLRAHGVEVVTVSEEQILRATLSVVQRMKLVVEPSAATVLAALRHRADDVRGKRIGAILSGGNTDFRWLDDPALRDLR
jgi:threonine dehydratase